jgi:tRNA-dihydrouridine synthase
MNFWKDIEGPIFTMAPMEDVSETVFRELVASTASPGRLHVLFTEFMSVDGFLHERGHLRVSERLLVTPEEREVLERSGIKLVAQIWGSDPEKFHRATRKIAEEHRFDGIDINMGCPVKKIIKKGGCSNLIATPELAREIVAATREASDLPVSVKTRIGIREAITEEWIGQLLEEKPAAITVHGRTQKMMSEGTADWNEVGKASRLRDQMNSETLILGNGDVMSYGEGLQKAADYSADGIMIGRGIFANPAFFSTPDTLDTEARLRLLRQHITRFRATWEGKKSYAILKRFFKIYANSFTGASDFRARLMDSLDYEGGLKLLGEFESS